MEYPDPDALLMTRFQRGDDAAFEQILDKYQGLIVNFIYKIVNNRAEAEELAQEVFLRMHRAKRSYEPRARLAAWIYKIATNVSLRALEQSRRMPVRAVREDADGRTTDPLLDHPDPADDAETTLVRGETGAVIRRAIESLPERERIAVVLRRYEELSYAEIAAAMDCSEAAVKTYLHRGKLRLRQRLLPYLRGERNEMHKGRSDDRIPG